MIKLNTENDVMAVGLSDHAFFAQLCKLSFPDAIRNSIRSDKVLLGYFLFVFLDHNFPYCQN